MLLSALLVASAATTQFPILTGLVKELWLGLTLFIGAILTVYKIRLDKKAALKKNKEDAESRDKGELASRLKRMEEEIHSNTHKHTAAQLEREKLVDAYNTRNQNVEQNYNVRFQALENKVSQVDQLVMEVNGIKTEVKVQHTLMRSMESQISEMKNNSQRQFEHIIDLLKENRTK